MLNFPKSAALAMLIALLPTATLGADRLYGSVEGLELRVEDDLEAPGVYLQVWHFDAAGKGQQLVLPLRMQKQGAGQNFSGMALARGVEQRITISLSDDRAALDWRHPEELRLANGETIQMSGEHPLLDESARKSMVQQQFAAADKQLNSAFGMRRDRMDADDFAELRANQRLWLKFRDWFVADGDDADINGPGSVPFLRQQIARTLDRIAFLRALAKSRSDPSRASGLYSDGMDRELRLRTHPTTNSQVFFSLNSALPGLHDRALASPLVVSGRASSNGGTRGWTADGSGVNSNPIVTSDSELLIEPANDHESMTIISASAAVFTGRLYRIDKLQPANEPMREILRQLPLTVFDNTTEGLSAEDRSALLTTGRAPPFELRDSDADSIRVAYAEGSVSLRRFPRIDGGAWVAVETTNVRARSFELWVLEVSGAAASRLDLRAALPNLSAQDFFTDSKAADRAEGQIDYTLSQLPSTIEASWVVEGESPQADFQLEIVWDGFGLGNVERRPR